MHNHGEDKLSELHCDACCNCEQQTGSSQCHDLAVTTESEPLRVETLMFITHTRGSWSTCRSPKLCMAVPLYAMPKLYPFCIPDLSLTRMQKLDIMQIGARPNASCEHNNSLATGVQPVDRGMAYTVMPVCIWHLTTVLQLLLGTARQWHRVCTPGEWCLSLSAYVHLQQKSAKTTTRCMRSMPGSTCQLRNDNRQVFSLL